MLIQTAIIVGVILTGLVCIVHPPAGRKIAKRAASVVLAIFAIDEILSYLWANRIGRLLLIVAAIFIVAALARVQKE